MITNPHAKRVLLYGDSYVYGKMPGQNKRWATDQRFSGIAQRELGDSFDIIEEGLRARTMKGENDFFPNRDGLIQFSPIIGSHLPCAAVVLMLGTNNANSRSAHSPSEVADTLKEYLQIIEQWSEFLEVPKPQLLVVGSPNIVTEQFDAPMSVIFGQSSADKSREIREALEHRANSLGLPYLDASTSCKVGADGIHLDEENNQTMGIALSRFIREHM